MLEATLRRYRCTGCEHVWRQDASRAAEPRAKPSRRGLRWALEGIVHQHPTVARAAEGLGVAWHTANDAVPAKGKRVLIDHPDRLDGVTAIGVDQHVRRRTGRGDKHVTVIIDLTAIHDGTGPARLSDMVEGRSEQAFTTRPAERSRAWRDHRVEVIAMDGFTGFTTATTEGPLTAPAPYPADDHGAPGPRRRSSPPRAAGPAHRPAALVPTRRNGAVTLRGSSHPRCHLHQTMHRCKPRSCILQHLGRRRLLTWKRGDDKIPVIHFPDAGDPPTLGQDGSDPTRSLAHPRAMLVRQHVSVLSPRTKDELVERS